MTYFKKITSEWKLFPLTVPKQFHYFPAVKEHFCTDIVWPVLLFPSRQKFPFKKPHLAHFFHACPLLTSVFP